MNIKYWVRNPKFIIPRIRYFLYEIFHPENPWWIPEIIAFLDHRLSKKNIALEWGSGRSTLWLANRVERLISIEHNKGWYDRIIRKLKEKRYSNVEYHYIPLDHCKNELTYPHYEKKPAYLKIAELLSDDSLDFISIDGHYRQACVLISISKLKNGGLLLIDDSNWLPLEEWGVPNNWAVICQFNNGLKQATIWKKNK